MVTAMIVFVSLCVSSVCLVSSLYKSLEIKDLKEKLSWYTTSVAPVPTVLGETEELADE